MTSKRKPYKTYTREFKCEAVRMMRASDRPAAEIAVRGRTPPDLAVVAEGRTSFFGFDLSVPGPTAREVLEGFGAVRSE